MRFDDRLATVLAQPIASPRDRAVRWRQLVDLVARSGGAGDPDLIDRSLATIREDRVHVDESLRSAAARAIAGKPVPLSLLALFASDSLAVATPLLSAVDVTDDRLDILRRAASDDVRRYLDSFHGSIDPSEPARPASEQAVIEETAAAPPPPPPVPTPTPPPESVSRTPAMDDGPSLFRWECNPGGEIEWVEGAPRGALIGRSIADADPEQGVDDCVERAFKMRAPFRNCLLELGVEGRLGGEWTIDGSPAFASSDGRFIGYRGVARRGAPDELAMADEAEEQSSAIASHDSLREMIHEIKTPLNAIIGFAEMIDGQYFGPAHRRYRERAAQIVSNARLLLEAAEDLDFVARVQAAPDGATTGTDFATFMPGFLELVSARAVRQGVLIETADTPLNGRCRLNPELTERLMRRFTDTIAGAATPGERIDVTFVARGVRAGLALARPKAIGDVGEDKLLDPEFQAVNGGAAMLGIGFAMRLLSGLVGLAGGKLEIEQDRLVLLLPLAKE